MIKLSTYSIGADRTVDEWRTLCRSLIYQGYLDETTDGYSVLKLNAKSNQVLKKLTSVEIPVSSKIEKSVTSVKKTADAELSEIESLLMSQLRTLRKKLADEQSVPPYIVFF